MRRLSIFIIVSIVLTIAAFKIAKADSYDIPNKAPLSVSGCPKAGWPQGALINCLFDSAVKFRNQPTKWRGTECPGQPNTLQYWGHCACAAAASVVMMIGTRLKVGYINVDQFYATAKHGAFGGAIVPDAKARKGDIILWYSKDEQEAHIGFCATAGCTLTWSNSSYYGKFAPVAHSISLDGYYPIHYIWDPVHIPSTQVHPAMIQPQFLRGPAPRASPSTHAPEFYPLKAATAAYVRTQHPGNREHPAAFLPKISCIQIGADRKSAIVNFSAGPENDPISTAVVFANTERVSGALTPQIRSDAVQGWTPIAATTSQLSAHNIQQASVRPSVVSTATVPCS